MSLIPISLPDGTQFDIEALSQESDYITSCMIKFNNWEPNLTQKFISILGQAKKNNIEGIVLDIGSCFGYYSLLAAQYNFSAIAFEPNPETLKILKRNVTLSGKDLITVRERGLGNESGQKSLQMALDNVGGSSLTDLNPEEGVPIEIRKLNDEPIDEHVIICKIDVEGYEPEVIQGGLETIRRAKVEFLILEISSKFCPVDRLTDEIFIPLWNEGYLSFDIGLQDSGNIEYSIKKLKPISSGEGIRDYLADMEQTNFLFVRKKEAVGDHLTGERWKDELLMKWSLESTEEKEKDLEKLSTELLTTSGRLEDEKKENIKLFEELNKAAAFQKELLFAIQEKDKTIAETENLKIKLMQGIDSIRHITDNIIT